MSAIGKRIDEIIAAGPARFLKLKGFKKTARTWRRAFADGVQVVHLQASQHNLGATGRFTLNLGAYLPRVEELLGRERLSTPREHQCTLRQHVGALTPGRLDYWWEVDDSTELDDMAIDVCEKLEVFGLPWLDLAAREREFRVLAQTASWRGTTLNEAVAALLEHDRESARRVVQRVVSNPSTPSGERDDAVRLASRAGLT